MKLRIAIGSAFVIVGASLVGPAVNSMLQPEAWPTWVIILLIIGVITLISGLLILIVPQRYWRRIWEIVIGFPNWLKETYLWKRYGPERHLNQLSLEQPLADHQDTYKAIASLYIKNRDNNALIMGLGNPRFSFQQRLGRRTLSVILTPPVGFTSEFKIGPHEEGNFEIPFIGFCNGADCPDLGKPYQWRIQGIRLELEGIKRHWWSIKGRHH